MNELLEFIKSKYYPIFMDHEPKISVIKVAKIEVNMLE